MFAIIILRKFTKKMCSWRFSFYEDELLSKVKVAKRLVLLNAIRSSDGWCCMSVLEYDLELSKAWDNLKLFFFPIQKVDDLSPSVIKVDNERYISVYINTLKIYWERFLKYQYYITRMKLTALLNILDIFNNHVQPWLSYTSACQHGWTVWEWVGDS